MSQSTFSEVGRVVAIGDLHGNYNGFRKILQNTGLIDKQGHWKAKNTHLIQLGDILGRGGEPGKIFKLLRRMEMDAPRFNSHVHVLLGNHEAMSMSGLLIYNTLEEFQDLAEQDFADPWETKKAKRGDGEVKAKLEASQDWSHSTETKMDKRMSMIGCKEFRANLSPRGKVGRWLATHDTAIVVNGTLFVHGGLNQAHGLQPLGDLNRQVRKELAGLSSSDAGKDLTRQQDGPQWNREFTIRPNEKKGRELGQVLDYHQCLRMVVGHTPTCCIRPSQAGRIVELYDEKLLCIDTGIGKSYGENLSALSIEHGVIATHYL